MSSESSGGRGPKKGRTQAGYLGPFRSASRGMRRGARTLVHSVQRRWPYDHDELCRTEKVFILSTGRTGTLFLAHFFQTFSESVAAFHEPYPSLLSLGLDYAYGHVTLQQAADQLLRDRHWRISRAHALVYLELNNRLFSLPRALLQAFPEARILHLVRDGRAVVCSGMQRGWYAAGDKYPRLQADRLEGDPWQDHWAAWSPFEKICWLWQKQNQIIREEGSGLRSYRLWRFEDLFNGAPDSWRAMRNLVADLDPRLTLTDAQLAEAMAGKVNASEMANTWQDWSPEQTETFWYVAGAEMSNMGYDVG